MKPWSLGKDAAVTLPSFKDEFSRFPKIVSRQEGVFDNIKAKSPL
jgi:hypothetical protein